jgi:hypothetical protein
VIRTEIENPLQHPRLVVSLLALTTALTIGYLSSFDERRHQVVDLRGAVAFR